MNRLPLSQEERAARLCKAALSRSFVPQTDIDWSNHTTDAEYTALYGHWSLLQGTGEDAGFSARDRINFVKYQQMNLMLFTGMLERLGLPAFIEINRLKLSPAFQEYLSHFIKEEVYHDMLFQRAVAEIHGTMGELPPVPVQRVERFMRFFFGVLRFLPMLRFRVSVSVMLFRAAEQATMVANQVVHRAIPRKESMVNRVWACHALDEARHLAFDDLILDRYGVRAPWKRLGVVTTLLFSVISSLFLNAMDVWAARKLGLKLGFGSVPRLMRLTTATFKRRVFAMASATWKGHSSQQILGDSFGVDAAPGESRS